MSKAKSIVITVVLALAVAVAAFFAAISFPVENNVKRLNSIASNIHLGAEYSGYAYTTIYPEGVITDGEYDSLVEDFAESEKKEEDKNPEKLYTKAGRFYIENEVYGDEDGKISDEAVKSLKEKVSADAAILNERFGKKGYSSYSVAVEDGLSVKISVPTGFTRAAYKNYDLTSRSEDLNQATYSIAYLTCYGGLTLRVSDTSIEYTDADDKTNTIDLTKKGNDEWVGKANAVDGSGSSVTTYLLSYGDDPAEYIQSVTSRTVGSNSVITITTTKDGLEKFTEITSLAASSESKTLYFFIGDRQLVSFKCESAVTTRSISLQASDAESAQNSAIALNSVVNGKALSLNYQDLDSILTSSAEGGEEASLFAFIACLVVLAALAVALVVKYKKLGALTAFLSVIFALIELYALCILGIQVTAAVIVVCAICLALFIVCNVLVFEQVRKFTAGGRTIQASVKDAYKKLIMTVTDMHIVLVVAAILLAAVAAGEAAACGLIAVIGVVASYVMYWFTRFMWYVTSSPVKDKFRFAGIKRVVYEDD